MEEFDEVFLAQELQRKVEDLTPGQIEQISAIFGSMLYKELPRNWEEDG